MRPSTRQQIFSNAITIQKLLLNKVLNEFRISLVFIVLAVSATNLLGQTENLKQTEVYIEFKATPVRAFSKKDGYDIWVNFGQKYLSQDSLTTVRILSKIESCNKIDDVLQYMNTMGWKLVTAYTTSHDHYFTYYYIMKRETE